MTKFSKIMALLVWDILILDIRIYFEFRLPAGRQGFRASDLEIFMDFFAYICIIK
jgi:hypothetical protein